MDKIDIIELRKMSYNELRAYAKKFNIKCNAKASKLIDAILEKNNQQNSDNNSSLLSETDMDHENTDLEQTPFHKQHLHTENDETPKTPAAAIKARRRTYELTPENTLVLDVDTAKDVAKTNPVRTARMNTPTTKTATPPKPEKENAKTKRSKIPVQEKKTRSRICATPNFQKLHEREFAKMESLDVYVAKKAARLQNNRFQQCVKSVQSLGLKFTKQGPASADANIFKPTVLSTSALDLNFAQTTKARQTRANVKSKLPAVSNKTPFRFLGKSVINSKTPLQKLPIPSTKGAKPTFRYQPPKQQEKKTGRSVAPRSNKKVRENSRSMLKGVRLNKRFELQLEARGIVLK